MKNIIITILSVLVVVLAVFAGYSANNKEVVEKEVLVIETVVDNSTLEALANLTAKVNSLDEFEVEADEKLQNETAKDLVLAEMDKKEFMKEVLTVLESEGKSIESYKDLEVYTVKIKESELGDDDTAVVTVEIRVSGIEDDDEELDFRAKLLVEFLVSELVVDDEFEDADVEEYSIEVLRVYD